MEHQKYGHQDNDKNVLLMYQTVFQRIRELEKCIEEAGNIRKKIGYQEAKRHNEEILKALMVGTDASLNAVIS